MKHCIILLTIFTLISCRETELQKTIFLPDGDAPGLPVYSEWGYNSFGTYYDRVTFVSRDATPAKVILKENKLSFVLIGSKGSVYTNTDFSMTITTPQSGISTYPDLVFFNATVFDLSDPKYEVSFQDGSTSSKAQVLNGKFEIRRTQYLLVDTIPQEVILSGVFEFQAIVNGIPVTVSSGRFDVGIGNDNFYKL